MEDLYIPGHVAAQLAYHMRMAVAFAAADNRIECASETTLGLTLLSLYRFDEAELGTDLPDPAVADTSTEHWDALCSRTEALARELQAHFVSEGQYALAATYETAATAVQATIAPLRARR